MYKDKDKQRGANAERQRRYKAKQKALLNQGVTDKALSCDGLKLEDARNIMMEREGMTSEQLDQATERLIKRPSTKRSKDIKCFEDLPLDVQATINQMCRIDDNKIDATAKANRTAIAIRYQHMTCDVTKEGIKYG